MLVSEMIRRLRVPLQDEEQPYKNSTDRILLWLQGAYMDRQLQSSYWKFLHQAGIFIVTEAGTADYSVPVVKDIVSDSLYYMRAGSNARIPVRLKDYHEWMEEQAVGAVVAPSSPIYLIELPSQAWRVEPTPDAVYRIFADRWYRPTEFANTQAAPIWEEEYHEIVVLDAMKIAAALRPESAESAVMLQQVRERLPKMDRAFKARYLPAIGCAGPFL